jgi:hypothetical protein
MPIPTIHTMDPAYGVIERLGGKADVAHHLKLDKSTLSRWCQPRPDGTGGQIPQRHWPDLLEMARAKGVTIEIKELVAVEV